MSVVLNFNNGIILSIPSFDIRNFQNLTTRHNPNYLLLLLYIRLASYVATKNLISNRSAKIGVNISIVAVADGESEKNACAAVYAFFTSDLA